MAVQRLLDHFRSFFIHRLWNILEVIISISSLTNSTVAMMKSSEVKQFKYSPINSKSVVIIQYGNSNGRAPGKKPRSIWCYGDYMVVDRVKHTSSPGHVSTQGMLFTEQWFQSVIGGLCRCEETS